MKSDTKNPFDSLCELLTIAHDIEQDEINVFCQLNFSDEEIELDEGFCISVGIHKAVLQAHLFGAQAVLGSHHNNPPKALVEKSRSHRKLRTAQGAVAAGTKLGVSTSTPKAKVQASGNTEISTTHETEEISNESWTETPVRYKSGNRWSIEDVSSVSDSVLCGNYISNERLLAVTKSSGANRTEIECSVIVKKSDFEVQPEGNPFQRRYRSAKHKEKFMKAIIGKAIMRNSGQDSAWVTVSSATLLDDEYDAE
ncbi:hypothetical protein [Salibaculum griseiflavum]|uniref:hypothetical protein n=1 Tax=Salibaculum griseiflavum TaxID=1914409 RepID=UPI0011B1F6E5|nr:hypothetical protein [Salibaculum griseiflavum]